MYSQIKNPKSNRYVSIHSKSGTNILKNIGGFSENVEYITAEDYDLWLKLAKNKYQIEFIKNILGTFRIHQFSESKNILKNTNAVCSIIQNHCKYDDTNKNKLNAYIANSYITAGKIFQLSNSKYSSLKYYIKAIKLKPTQLKPYYMIISLLLPITLLKMIRKIG